MSVSKELEGWTQEVERAMKELEQLGTGLPEDLQGPLLSDVMHVARQKADKYRREANRGGRAVRNLVADIVPSLKPGRFYTTLSLSEQTKQSNSAVYTVLKRVPGHTKLGLVYVPLDRDYWMKLADEEPELITDAPPSWAFVMDRLQRRGYCESPGILRHQESGRQSAYDRIRTNSGHGLTDMKQFSTWSQTGDSVFDEFVERSGYTTSTLYDMPAIVYHPALLKRAQGIEV